MHPSIIVNSVILSAGRLSAVFFLAWIICGSPVAAFAGGGPENLVLVVNANSESSKLLANYYIRGRGIPSRNVIYLADIPDREIIQWPQFRAQILEPLLNEIQRRKLVGQVDYVVYSSDFPTTIVIGEHRTKLLEKLKEQDPTKSFLFSGQSISGNLKINQLKLLTMNHFWNLQTRILKESL